MKKYILIIEFGGGYFDAENYNFKEDRVESICGDFEDYLITLEDWEKYKEGIIKNIDEQCDWIRSITLQEDADCGVDIDIIKVR